VADFDPTIPSIARVYDYFMGGSDNFAADRELGERLISLIPSTPVSLRENRAFIGLAVAWAASLNEPACLIMGSLLHFFPAEQARDLVARYVAALAPGSYLILTMGVATGEAGERFSRLYSQGPSRLHLHAPEDFRAFFGPTELVPPGIRDAGGPASRLGRRCYGAFPGQLDDRRHRPRRRERGRLTPGNGQLGQLITRPAPRRQGHPARGGSPRPLQAEGGGHRGGG
jgi:hypothetical protein